MRGKCRGCGKTWRLQKEDPATRCRSCGEIVEPIVAPPPLPVVAVDDEQDVAATTTMAAPDAGATPIDEVGVLEQRADAGEEDAGAGENRPRATSFAARRALGAAAPRRRSKTAGRRGGFRGRESESTASVSERLAQESNAGAGAAWILIASIKFGVLTAVMARLNGLFARFRADEVMQKVKDFEVVDVETGEKLTIEQAFDMVEKMAWREFILFLVMTVTLGGLYVLGRSAARTAILIAFVAFLMFALVRTAMVPGSFRGTMVIAAPYAVLMIIGWSNTKAPTRVVRTKVRGRGVRL